MTTTFSGFEQAQNAINALASDATKRAMLAEFSKYVTDNSKKRVRAQTGLSGTGWERRKDGMRKKMLVKVGQQIRTISVSSSEAVIGFSSPVMGKIAYQHQYGIATTMTASLLSRITRGNISSTDSATRRQAKALLAVGFKVRKQGGGFKTPTIKWITENLTIGKAGSIIRSLRGHVADEWVIPLPARNFLGITDAEKEEMTNRAFARLHALWVGGRVTI